MPSLSVVQTEPSRFRNDAPALSSPAKPNAPEPRPSTNHLKPTGVSTSLRFSLPATRSMIELETMVLPIAACCPHSGRCSNEQISNARPRENG